jgi:hypothetical protein
MAMVSISCADNLKYEFKRAAAVCIGPDCADNDRNVSEEGNYTEDMQWGRSQYQTLSLKHVAVKSDYIYGNVMIGANDIDFSVEQVNSSNPEYTVLYSGENFDQGLRYGTFEASLKLILDDEEYYTDQIITWKDFDHFSAYNVARFSDGAIEKEGFIGGFNVYSNSVVTKGDSSLVTGFNSIVSY